MGIGSTMKHMLSNEHEGEHGRDEHGRVPSHTAHEASHARNTSPHTRLPAGTGPGTSGHPEATRVDPAPGEARRAELPSGRDQINAKTGKRTSQLAMEHDAQRALHGESIEGYGTDAAAAAGGSLSASHQGASSGGAKHRLSVSKPSYAEGQGNLAMPSAPPVNNLDSVSENLESWDQRPAMGSGNVEALPRSHLAGHSRSNEDVMPTPDAQEDTSQLQPIMHERVRHVETEEVTRVKDHERHIHHIQHHTQPVIVFEEHAEQHRDNVLPVTVINETHANKPEDTNLLENQVRQFRDTVTHIDKERTVIDKGVTITEHVHHHVHHVIQPVIEKETIERHIIHTTVPIHEITQEAPVVHQSQTHAPVPLEHFLSRGGVMKGAVTHDEISGRVLQTGQCGRQVDGVAEKLEKELNLKPDAHLYGQKMGAEEMNRPTVAPVGRN